MRVLPRRSGETRRTQQAVGAAVKKQLKRLAEIVCLKRFISRHEAVAFAAAAADRVPAAGQAAFGMYLRFFDKAELLPAGADLLK